MPEVRFSIRWPDGTIEQCYSPSTVIAEHLTPHTTYPLDEFMARCGLALTRASDRVQARYGMPCGLARSQKARLEAHAAEFTETPNPSVAVLAFEA